MRIKNISGVARYFSLIESRPLLSVNEILTLSNPSLKALAKVRQYVMNGFLEVTGAVTLEELSLDNLGIVSDVLVQEGDKILTVTV